jgi:hypothetical protein
MAPTAALPTRLTTFQLLLPAVAGFVLLMAQPVAAQGVDHTLTQASNGATITAATGDTVTLRLGADLDWSGDVGVSDNTVLQQLPDALARGVQGVWRAVAPGTATVHATGRPICDPNAPCPQFLATFSAAVVVSGAPPPPANSASYPSGWNIVGGPAGTTFPVTLFAWDVAAAQYDALALNTPVEQGKGYWAYFSQPAQVPLGADSNAPARSLPAHTFVLIASPFATHCAGINIGPPSPPGQTANPTVAAVYTYDPAQGQYGSGTGALLKPGQGAWVLLDRPGSVPIVDAGARAADGSCIAPP